MTREPTLLDDIYEGEVEDITFPCAKSLKPGETIADVVITCSRIKGAADDAAATRTATPRQIVGTDVVQRMQGHLPCVWYLLDALVTLSSGRVLRGEGIVYSKPRSTA